MIGTAIGPIIIMAMLTSFTGFKEVTKIDIDEPLIKADLNIPTKQWKSLGQ